MSYEHLTVPEVPLPGEPVNQNSAVQNISRNNSDVVDNSRAQLVSSDLNRGPRRPSMTVEPSQRDLEISDQHTRREHVRVHRGANHPDERRGSNARRRSIQSTHENFPRPWTETVHDRRVSNGHLPRDNEPSRVIRNPIYALSTRHNQTGTLRDLPVDAMSHRRREFQGVSSARTRGSNYEDLHDDDDHYIVPALPMPIAVMCCVLNFIIPGFGSMAASICVFCCAKTDDMTFGEKCGSCCTVFGIGVLQLLLVACFLIGWIWSCIWGVTFIGMSASYYDDDDGYYDHENTPSNNPAYHRSVRGRTPLPTPQVVVDQPFPGIRYDDIQRARNRRREAHRRSRSRISLTPSNVIYPMRAPSNITYNSPPPPYQATVSPPPTYDRDQNDSRRMNHDMNHDMNRDMNRERHQDRRRQNNTDTIPEDYR